MTNDAHRPSVAMAGLLAGFGTLLAMAPVLAAGPQQRPAGEGFSFRSGVNLVNVTTTVTDAGGRFVPNLRAEDFEVYEDGVRQTISQFEAERVPVSLGIALDTSGSMVGDKIRAARAALDRFLLDLLGPDDEVFLYRFDSRPTLVQGWTGNRRALSAALGAIKPVGGTAIYDTVAQAVPFARTGTRQKKALVVISDGADTSSRIRLDAVRRLIQESELLVYAIGIDASGNPVARAGSSGTSSSSSRPLPVPTAFPGQKPVVRPATPSPPPSRTASPSRDRINVDALRALTDDSGGRTEVVVGAADLDPATAGIADELSRQYFIGYVSSVPRDGRWHTIDVRVGSGAYTVRARRGFIAN